MGISAHAAPLDEYVDASPSNVGSRLNEVAHVADASEEESMPFDETSAGHYDEESATKTIVIRKHSHVPDERLSLRSEVEQAS